MHVYLNMCMCVYYIYITCICNPKQNRSKYAAIDVKKNIKFLKLSVLRHVTKMLQALIFSSEIQQSI